MPCQKSLGRCRGFLSTPTRHSKLFLVFETVPSPVTLKMRRGIDDSQDSQDKFFTIFDAAFSRGVSPLCMAEALCSYNVPAIGIF